MPKNRQISEYSSFPHSSLISRLARHHMHILIMSRFSPPKAVVYHSAVSSFLYRDAIQIYSKRRRRRHLSGLRERMHLWEHQFSVHTPVRCTTAISSIHRTDACTSQNQAPRTQRPRRYPKSFHRQAWLSKVQRPEADDCRLRDRRWKQQLQQLYHCPSLWAFLISRSSTRYFKPHGHFINTLVP